MPIDNRFIHDLNNQLGIIAGYVQLLLEATPPSDPRHADLLEIERAAAAAIALAAAQRQTER